VIARRYAKALLSIGVADKQFERYGQEIKAFAQAYSDSKDLREVLENPVFPVDQRIKAVEAMARRIAAALGGEPSQPVVNFLKLLVDRKRIGEIVLISLVLSDLVDELARRVRATVVSARPLSPEARANLERAIAARAEKSVVLEAKTDPEQIGGVTVQIGDLIFDGSIRGQLERMKKQLEK
jgi:F-type H+-transporting ATPase subunit delta